MKSRLTGMLKGPYRSIIGATIAIFLLLSLWVLPWRANFPVLNVAIGKGSAESMVDDARYASAAENATRMLAHPLDKSRFGEMGQRMKVLREWIRHKDTAQLSRYEQREWSKLIESVAVSLIPFIQAPNTQDDRPLSTLRSRFVPGSKGLVITTGKKRFRYACHLITSLREVLNSTLPIQIAYSGDDDLPQEYRDFITSLATDVSTMDVTSIFDDGTLDLPHGGWAVKAFAVLGSTFEQVMLLDADAVFLQPPEVIFETHPAYIDTGTLLFHDRLLWKGAYKDRHSWWEKELENTTLSETIRHSKVFMEGYAEEGDSGVVVADKSRLDVFVGLLHIAWQNTRDVREALTYVKGHGDKESWWFGLELTETPYAMEQHYAAIVGHVRVDQEGHEEDRVCSFTIAHVDAQSRLLWFNGSLLKNKEIDSESFDVPGEWMIDGVWEKGPSKQDLSCMSGAQVRRIDQNLVEILSRSVLRAKQVDEELRVKIPSSML
ncbi:hypothetical protein PV08_01160 [Exophiala spinifera]|uniref:Alpha-1,3-mannosyltransferase n=1 Tax=Exophiala spinifera TaxID=91928 RepID=A0A0D2BQ08_9EURO|nr:uncharacterized protein PV08_01160 [Exophiala spinifera]KIW20585.1 hypothetical protein PV08_01160 [Exophiala spinifera]